jgi:hypothetical protein
MPCIVGVLPFSYHNRYTRPRNTEGGGCTWIWYPVATNSQVNFARRSFFRQNLQFEDAIGSTPARLKLLQACDQWHSSRMCTPLTGRLGKFRRNAKGKVQNRCWRRLTMNSATALMVSHNAKGKKMIGQSVYQTPLSTSHHHHPAPKVSCAFFGKHLRA